MGEDVSDILQVRKWEIEEIGDNFAYSSVEELLERAKEKYDSRMNNEYLLKD